MTNRAARCFLIFLLFASFCREAITKPLTRRAERPTAQAGLANSSSFLDRQFVLGHPGELSLHYFVDSEAGGDYLRVLVNGQQEFLMSGRSRGGRVKIFLPQGNMTVRFSYEKNGAVDQGRDTAWVDDVVVRENQGPSLRFDFDEVEGAALAGWQGGGTAGGWTVQAHLLARGLRRSSSVAYVGYNPGGIQSSIETSLTWSGANRNDLRVGYSVDSEEGHDFFRVYVDGQEKFADSGNKRDAAAVIDVGPAGTHTIRFAYEKDESVDEGTDDAVVSRFQASSDGTVFRVAEFDGEPVGAVPDEWQEGPGSSGAWVVTPVIQGTLELSALPFTTPVINGRRDRVYGQAGSRFRMPARGNESGDPAIGEVLVEPGTVIALITRLPAGTPALGDETGSVAFYLDAGADSTAAGVSCAPSVPIIPGASQRKFTSTFSLAADEGGATPTVDEWQGTCQNGGPAWEPVLGPIGVPATLSIAEDPSNPGFVVVELLVDGTSLGGSAYGLALEATLGDRAYRFPSWDGVWPIDAAPADWVRAGSAGTLTGEIVVGAQRRKGG